MRLHDFIEARPNPTGVSQPRRDAATLSPGISPLTGHFVPFVLEDVFRQRRVDAAVTAGVAFDRRLDRLNVNGGKIPQQHLGEGGTNGKA